MANNSLVALRCSELDKAALRELAARLQRNPSDTVRVLVRTTLEVLKEQDAKAAGSNQIDNQPVS